MSRSFSLPSRRTGRAQHQESARSPRIVVQNEYTQRRDETLNALLAFVDEWRRVADFPDELAWANFAADYVGDIALALAIHAERVREGTVNGASSSDRWPEPRPSEDSWDVPDPREDALLVSLLGATDPLQLGEQYSEAYVPHEASATDVRTSAGSRAIQSTRARKVG